MDSETETGPFSRALSYLESGVPIRRACWDASVVVVRVVSGSGRVEYIELHDAGCSVGVNFFAPSRDALLATDWYPVLTPNRGGL